MLTEADLPSHSFIPLRWMLALGGVARTHDFREHHCTDEDIRLATRYGSIQRIRIGWYAIPALDRAVVDAVRCGGRLACVSAVAYHESRDPGSVDHRLHVEVPANAIRRVPPDLRGKVRIHWVERPSPGDRATVARDAARRQAIACVGEC